MKTRAREFFRASHISDERGAALLMVTFAMVALLSFAVLAIDGAILMTTRTQLNNAADAAALAGASALVEGTREDAVERAIHFASYNKAHLREASPVIITPDDVTFPRPNVVRVRTHRTAETGDALLTFFLSIVNPSSRNRADMTAVAAAEAYDVCSSRCLKPWSIPDRWNDADGNGSFDAGDTYHPATTGYNAPGDVGVPVVLKVGDPHQTIAPGIFYAVDYPPLDNPDGEKPLTGAAVYKKWIEECVPYVVGVGDRLQVEPGRMQGPTHRGMERLIRQDPGAYWDDATQTVKGSAFPLSPRVGLVPFFDPTTPPRQGRSYVTVVKLGAFFIERIGKDGEVWGRFITITVQGPPCAGGESSSFVKSIALVE
jgi:Flp pilus assembly protein TadG